MATEIFAYTNERGKFSDRCIPGYCDIPLVSQFSLQVARSERDEYRTRAEKAEAHARDLEGANRLQYSITCDQDKRIASLEAENARLREDMRAMYKANSMAQLALMLDAALATKET